MLWCRFKKQTKKNCHSGRYTHVLDWWNRKDSSLYLAVSLSLHDYWWLIARCSKCNFLRVHKDFCMLSWSMSRIVSLFPTSSKRKHQKTRHWQSLHRECHADGCLNPLYEKRIWDKWLRNSQFHSLQSVYVHEIICVSMCIKWYMYKNHHKCRCYCW